MTQGNAKQHDLRTIEQATIEMREAVLSKGEDVRCPCCKQTVAVRPRALHATMVMQLIRMYWLGEAYPHGWVDVHDIYLPGAGGDYAKLRFWGLVEKAGARTKDANAPGQWRVTPKGKAFVLNALRVPKKVYTYNNQVVSADRLGSWSQSTETVNVEEALGDKFSYAQLMRAEG